ncbi:unnamed protein product [Cladocopium goreaui]|uniref:Protein Abitram (Actin-binding transcription modulator) (Protein Simiate) n=1 Tax=Cladocopium goreaui TaxID=2562237 RepID=A0A9P1DS62_9DINO|nr:unnamed protein product [Cladocopium goreaui]
MEEICVSDDIRMGALAIDLWHGWLFVISLAPSHPLLAPAAPKVTQVTFGADLAENEAYGKRCRGGANVGLRTVLAEVSSEAENYNICCPIEARLVELNALLQEDPQLLQRAPEDEGFLAILQARRPQDTQRILQKLLDESSPMPPAGEL